MSFQVNLHFILTFHDFDCAIAFIIDYELIMDKFVALQRVTYTS